MNIFERKREKERAEVMQVFDRIYGPLVPEFGIAEDILGVQSIKGEPFIMRAKAHHETHQKPYDDKRLKAVMKMVEELQKKYPSEPEKQIESLILRQAAKNAGLGFVKGSLGCIPGLWGLIVSLLTSLVKFSFRRLKPQTFNELLKFLDFQTKMVMAIACIRGHDLKDNDVMTKVELCMAGDKAIEVIEEIIEILKIGNELMGGIKDNKVLVEKLLPLVPNKVLEFRKSVVSKVSEKIGEKWLGRMIPIVGGFVRAAIGFTYTRSVAKTAKDAFPPKGDAPVK